eukprot:TRINITY_DN686_c0_g1_i3.p1 TRINITY_DN686_c0_g1~~TRINITY_DN686_c0_g1_i3.p1  ORF type:complete len:341 (+),score=148.59 TRINITY_DN686_c0_g1_i3:292-1314(+)
MPPSPQVASPYPFQPMMEPDAYSGMKMPGYPVPPHPYYAGMPMQPWPQPMWPAPAECVQGWPVPQQPYQYPVEPMVRPEEAAERLIAAGFASHGEKRWKCAADAGVDQRSAVTRTMTGLINKLTEKVLRSITQQVAETIVPLVVGPAADADLLDAALSAMYNTCVDTVDAKNVQQADLCATLCCSVAMAEAVAVAGPGEKPLVGPTKVRKGLVRLVQKNFQSCAGYARGEIMEGAAKRRAEGNITLLGALINQSILTPKTAHSVLRQLLLMDSTDAAPADAAVEAAMQLLRNTHAKVDVGDAAAEYADRLRCLSADARLSTRTRFRIETLLELRGRKWVR